MLAKDIKIRTDSIIEKALSWGGIASQVSRLDLGKRDRDWHAYAVGSHGFQPGPQRAVLQKSEQQILQLFGYGCHPDPQLALICAIAECVERKCAASWREEQIIESSADSLGDAALDLDSLPTCTDEEFKSPYCSLQAPRKDSTIRWVEGRLLGKDLKRWIPLVLSHCYTGYKFTGEYIAHSISTGCAAHSSPEAAAMSAILEVIERDALALTWLLQRTVPKVHLRDLDLTSKGYWSQHERLSPEVELEIFDITTDLRIPVLLCLQTMRTRPFAYTLLSCSSGVTYRDALQKVIRDATLCRFANASARIYPPHFEAFREVTSGAAYMADIARRDEFQFLTNSTLTIDWANLEERDNQRGERHLASLVCELENKNIDVYLVDLSTQESLDLGLNVKRAIIPVLQPISFHHGARYLAHRRLSNFRTEPTMRFYDNKTINSSPLPFA